MRLLHNRRIFVYIAIILVYALYSVAFGSTGAEGGEAEGGHAGPVLTILLQLVIILLAAKLGGDIFERFHQPAVLGELVIGMLLGKCPLDRYRFPSAVRPRCHP